MCPKGILIHSTQRRRRARIFLSQIDRIEIQRAENDATAHYVMSMSDWSGVAMANQAFVNAFINPDTHTQNTKKNVSKDKQWQILRAQQW